MVYKVDFIHYSKGYNEKMHHVVLLKNIELLSKNSIVLKCLYWRK